ncbi:hypothetical protein ACFVAD_20360 [Sutcliffiella sp. NPDC057660]|uniref:hypothetical protein n=1 Tax=Sutcliffiella sp. NPDC057660 TaxID=3346199 RepID=UPI0036CF587E
MAKAKIEVGNDVVEQLSIFEMLEPKPDATQDNVAYSLRSEVTVLEPAPTLEDKNPEDYFYLKSFAKQRGYISSIQKNNRATCYTVEFQNGIGFFYCSDIQLVETDDNNRS